MRLIRVNFNLIGKRYKTEFILARWVDGKLVEANFSQNDKSFSYNPRITASGKYFIDKSFLI